MSNFVNDFLKTGAGNVLTQLVSILTIPIITRLYTPNEYGIYAAALSLSLIIAPLMALRYNSALLVPSLSVNTIGLLWLSCIITAILSVILIVVVLVANSLGIFANILGSGSSSEHLWWLVVIIIAPAFNLNFQMAAIKHRRFNSLAIARIAEIGADRCFALLSGFLGAALATNLMMSRALGAIASWLIFFFSAPISIAKRSTWKRLYRLALRYRSFPLSSTPATLIDALGRQLPIVIMAAYLSPDAVGCYALALQLVNMPLVLLGDALSSVYISRAASQKSDHAYIASLSIPIIKIAILCFVPFAVFMNTTGIHLFSYIFGNKWIDAGFYAAITSLAIGIMFLHRILSSLFEIFEKTKLRLGLDVVLFVFKVIGVLFLCKSSFSAPTVIAYITACNFLVYLIGILYIAHKILGISPSIFRATSFFFKLVPFFILGGWIAFADPGKLFQSMLWIGLTGSFLVLQLKSEYLLLKGK